MSGEYEVKSGDCINSIAFENGFFWETIWNHPNNQDLKKLRKDPSVLFAGDQVFVPDLTPRTETRGTDARHKFVRNGVPAKISLTLTANQVPRANVKYSLAVDGIVFQGTTGPDGKIEHPIPPNAKSGKLTVMCGGVAQTQNLDLGYMDPITEMAGVQRRLVNLGYPCDIGGTEGAPGMQKALASFQNDQNLPVTGELDDATRQRIQRAHGK